MSGPVGPPLRRGGGRRGQGPRPVAGLVRAPAGGDASARTGRGRRGARRPARQAPSRTVARSRVAALAAPVPGGRGARDIGAGDLPAPRPTRRRLVPLRRTGLPARADPRWRGGGGNCRGSTMTIIYALEPHLAAEACRDVLVAASLRASPPSPGSGRAVAVEGAGSTAPKGDAPAKGERPGGAGRRAVSPTLDRRCRLPRTRANRDGARSATSALLAKGANATGRGSSMTPRDGGRQQTGGTT